MAKKKSDHAILQEYKKKNITLVRLNGHKVTIHYEEPDDSGEKSTDSLTRNEYPIEDFVKALAAMKTYVVNEWKAGSGAPRSAFMKSIEIRSVTFVHKGGEVKAKVRVHKELPDGLHCEFDMPVKPLLIPDSKGNYPPPPAEGNHYGEDQSAKLYEIIKQAKLYLGGHRSQMPLPFPEGKAIDKGTDKADAAKEA